jgi:ubiquinone/menaquinone biosynthesis C-methylase UbiE
MLIVVAVFDPVADRYDETRGGEPRGDAYAAQLAQWLAPGRAVLEVGAGTGVVALGLQRRGFRVIGVDASHAMLAKARNRLGPVVVRGDVRALPFRSASFDQAVAVWVLHSVSDPSALFAETGRVLRPSGRFVICPVNRPAPEDQVGQDFEAMGLLVDRVTGRPDRTASAAQILRWAETAGFQGHTEDLAAQAWPSTTDREIKAILDRSAFSIAPFPVDGPGRPAPPASGGVCA